MAVHVIGVGSPFGADRIGWEVVDRIASEVEAGRDWPADGFALRREDRPGLRLLEWLAAPGLVVLIDAVRSDDPPGTLYSFDGRALPAEACFATTHDFGMKAALDLAEALGEMVAEVRVFGIGIGTGEMQSGVGQAPGAGLSAIVDRSGIINNIKELVNNYWKPDRLFT